MYEAFYGMTERPFALTPDPSFLFMSRKHKLAFSMLEYALTGQAGFTVITGAIGSGKTTLIRHLLKRTNRGVNYGVISNTHESFGCLLQWILTAFGIAVGADERANRYQAFVRYLIAQFRDGKQTILIIDEAQNLSIEALEELRLLSNINADKDQLLQMILVGQPELLAKLRRPELVQFAQRISVSYHLSPLSFVETRGYIAHRLYVAGADPKLFSDLAMRAVFHFTGGVPRLINSICDMALVYGYAEALSEIGIDTILSVIKDKEAGALLPIFNVDLTQDRDTVIAAINTSATDSLANEDVVVKEETSDESDVLSLDNEVPPRSFNNDNAHGAELNRRATRPPLVMPEPRLSSANTIVPIISHRPRRHEAHGRMKWFLRLL